MNGWVVEIDRADFAKATLAELKLPSLQPGQVAVSIDSFGLTANNVTYAVFGQYAPDFGTGGGYFDYFEDPDEPSLLPVWGFATVTQCLVEGIDRGWLFTLERKARSERVWRNKARTILRSELQQEAGHGVGRSEIWSGARCCLGRFHRNRS